MIGAALAMRKRGCGTRSSPSWPNRMFACKKCGAEMLVEGYGLCAMCDTLSQIEAQERWRDFIERAMRGYYDA